MRKLILTLAVLGLVMADTQAFGGRRPVRSLIGRVLHRPTAAPSCGGCDQSSAGPVRQAVGNVFEHTGNVLVGAGNVIHSTTFRPAWDTPGCPNGYCPIPATNLPVR